MYSSKLSDNNKKAPPPMIIIVKISLPIINYPSKKVIKNSKCNIID
jgi:hypothetical protein